IRRSEDNPQRRTFRRAMETAFDELPYRRAVLGPESVIAELKPQQMRDFHANWYQPQSITAVAVGNLPVEELIATVAEGFTKLSTDAINRVSAHSHSATPFDYAQDKLTASPVQTRSIASLPTESPFTKIVRREFRDESLQQARLVMVWR
ncbi:MAG: insulinase family protein, partial [Nostoc sp.]